MADPANTSRTRPQRAASSALLFTAIWFLTTGTLWPAVLLVGRHHMGWGGALVVAAALGLCAVILAVVTEAAPVGSKDDN